MQSKIKVIFLDVDGVLNSEYTTIATSSGYRFVEDEYIRRLHKLVEVTDAKIVLSSDWRLSRDSDNNQDFNELKEKLLSFGMEIFDYTPFINKGRHRGTEIQKWLDDHSEVKDFVIIDDRYDMEPNIQHLICTNEYEGFTQENLEDAILVLTDFSKFLKNNKYSIDKIELI